MNREKGRVVAILSRRDGLSEILVRLKRGKEKAYNFEEITGTVMPGDRVILNTTAVRLKLGTGGFHFVCFNYTRPWQKMQRAGHIMKMRYTPHQLKVFSCEEEGNYREEIENFKSLEGKPVVIGELHSMLAPVVLSLKELFPGIRTGYIMTDSASLSLPVSRTVFQLKKNGLIDSTVTCGQAFGGDLEAVNLFTGLIAVFQVGRVDVAVITAGPGVTGTATRYGFSGMEVAENINRVASLGGTALVVPRLSFTENRLRHWGISHHTLTPLALPHVSPAYLPLPPLDDRERPLIMEKLEEHGIFKSHRVCSVIPPDLRELEHNHEFAMETMGRKVDEDPLFFLAGAAAGKLAGQLLKRHIKSKRTVQLKGRER